MDDACEKYAKQQAARSIGVAFFMVAVASLVIWLKVWQMSERLDNLESQVPTVGTWKK